MGARPWEADRVQSGQKSGCPIRGLRSGLLLSRALLDWGLGVEGLEGGVANLQDEVSEPLRRRPTAAGRLRRKCNYFTQF